jgi:hypothetical protein
VRVVSVLRYGTIPDIVGVALFEIVINPLFVKGSEFVVRVKG